MGDRQRVLRGKTYRLSGSTAEIAILERVLDAPDRELTAKLLRYFGLRWLEIHAATRRVNYAGSAEFCQPVSSISLTESWALLPRVTRQKILTHELLHAYGVDHNAAVGYSTQLSQDTLSDRVLAQVQRGSPTFDPQDFGLAPTAFGALHRRYCPQYDPAAHKGSASPRRPPSTPARWPRAGTATVELIRLRRAK